MSKIKTSKLTYSNILQYYDTFVSLAVLLDRSSLSNEVKNYCHIGFKVIGILYSNMTYSCGTDLLYSKEFDMYFKSFPDKYFNKREQISFEIIVNTIITCIKTNKVTHF